MWRTVSFVDNIELDFAGNVMTEALDLGDVDNDKENELVVGNIEGDLAVFKGDHSQPWKKASKLGMITCVQIGDIFNIYKNLLVCLNAEGCCYIFAVKGTEIPHLEDWRIGEENDVAAESKILTPVYTQNLPANSRAMLIRDTDGDGLQEMAVIYSDRVVRSFRWVPSGEGDSPFSGRLHQVDKWQLAGQIGAVTVNQRPDGSSELMVSQPGRTYVTLLPHGVCSTESDESKSPSFVFHPLGHSRARNKDVSTVIVGGIQRGEEGAATYHALASLDGTLVLVENDRILWSLQVDHQLFVLDKLDVTGNGKEEVVCCSWDGQTYIVNHSRDVVRYHFKENVAAFAAGYYSVPGKGNVPCFIYATFSDHIYIHHNISLPCVESATLLAVMQRYESTPSLLKNVGIDATKQDTVCALYHWLLYGWHQKPETTNVC
ncbi:hypothetical protein C0Q70_05022 [Pomacea canaliculata]|uniref:Integrin alpha FG-GAP repeat containing 2 n=1 Tax=Pomacea canaliculata TaxID=400727 RepID=A0A2T7PK42_POMCA|nr:KICSTOR complex protein ITFG2-like [Pomacea canaliculata]PVD33762.1 hypothetical protein C0Q70_05022 [Pomacea canaliculata]